MNAEVLPYHWDDRDKLYNDYQYLNNIYENKLKIIKNELNKIHSVNYSLRYWRILVGPWLSYFIQIVFDRWSMLKCAFENYEISGCRVLLNNESEYIPKDFIHFHNLFIDDNWNEMIYGQLLDKYWNVHIDLDYIKNNNGVEKNNNYQYNSLIRTSLGSLKQIFLRAINKYKSLMNSADNYFFFKTYLPSIMENELLQRLGQKPKKWETQEIKYNKINLEMRKWHLEGSDKYDDFSNIIDNLIPLHIPIAYLEGYNSLVNLAEYLTWPKTPKCIFTSNDIQSSDFFKAWVAQKVENGTHLVIGQHGGHYGIGKWNWIEEHEISISDRYLSWGWSDSYQPKIHPVGQIKNIVPLGINHVEQSGLLLVTGAIPRYSYLSYSVHISSQWLDYLEDQFAFVEKLHPDRHNNLTVRLYQHDYGWEQQERWRKRFPKITLDSGEKLMHRLIASTRLYVSTYNAATYLEAFTMDIPTVIFWNCNHWEIRDSSKPYFEDLKNVGIFHETPESAASHVSQVWDDIDIWWKSKSVRQALEKFKSHYSNIDCDLIGNIENELRETITS